ncbi:hypothetical protein CNMCM8980_005043 [Aspergillus fumigatiaffinis]|uniref:Uncharacterized protein n=1 Tax=Aspergillus fumigatiaffinis TaxID=340414 RepID=A0A8H4M7M0_9EURO|nr:hypothetical protein CNMCM8980_005043 [Aspergillus fumigatiaffinis]KAF4233528.1 hypothetical protein CNMCM6805_009185 [Aspergillus fumigatiaffinis]
MAGDEESLKNLNQAISSKILELESLTRAAGDAVVSDQLKHISQSEDQLLSLHRALVRKLGRPSRTDGLISERRDWFSSFVSHDKSKLSNDQVRALASVTKHWALSSDDIGCLKTCADLWAACPYLFCDGGKPDKDVIRRCYNDLERIEDIDSTRRKVLLVMFEYRKWSHIEIEALNAYVQTLPQFAIRDSLHNAWVSILEYYEGRARHNTAPCQTIDPSPRGIEESHDNIDSSAPQTSPPLDDHILLEPPASSDGRPVSCQDERCVRGDSQSSAMFFPTNASIATGIAPFSIDDIIASAEPWLFVPADAGDPNGDRARDYTNPAALHFPTFSIDEITASAEPWFLIPTDAGDPGDGNTKNPTDSRFTLSIDATDTSAGPQNVRPAHTDGYAEYPQVTSGLNTSNSLTFRTLSESVEAALEA